MAVTYFEETLRHLANKRLVRHRERRLEQEKRLYGLDWRHWIKWKDWWDARLNQLIKEKEEIWQTSIGTGRSVNDT